MTIEVASCDSVIIYFSKKIDYESNQRVKRVYKHLKDLQTSGFITMIPSYSSILITYDIFQYDFYSIKEYLVQQISSISQQESAVSDLVTIDVYYAKEVGLDLVSVATKKGISVDEVIACHSQKVYDVYAIGFLAGFAYLGEVDKKIHSPRLDSPRKKIPKGSVAIANGQTAVYPIDSPGGWNILGRTAFNLLDKKDKNLSPITINSQIKFNPISKEEFLRQGGVL